MLTSARYLASVKIVPDRLPPDRTYPFDLAFVPELNLQFESAVTYFVGENGTGKSSLLEAIAQLCRLPVSGGSRNELSEQHGPERDSLLSRVIRPAFRQ